MTQHPTITHRNAHIVGLAEKHIASLQAALSALDVFASNYTEAHGAEPSELSAVIDDSTRAEAQILIRGAITLLALNEHFVYQLHNAAAAAR